MTRRKLLAEFAARITETLFLPPARLAPSAYAEQQAMILRAAEVATPATLTDAQVVAVLARAAERLALDAETRAWPTPREVRLAVEREAMDIRAAARRQALEAAPRGDDGGKVVPIRRISADRARQIMAEVLRARSMQGGDE